MVFLSNLLRGWWDQKTPSGGGTSIVRGGEAEQDLAFIARRKNTQKTPGVCAHVRAWCFFVEASGTSSSKGVGRHSSGAGAVWWRRASWTRQEPGRLDTAP